MRFYRTLSLCIATGSLLAAGCAHYHFTSSVPEELRSISVPVFENATGFPEIGSTVTQYVNREFEREGTFKLAALDKASLKLLGRLESMELRSINYKRYSSSRSTEYQYALVATITLVERGTGKLLISEMPVRANTTFLTRSDMLTSLQNAAPRISKDLSRAIVDAVLAQWSQQK